jgi:hypothetical protein
MQRYGETKMSLEITSDLRQALDAEGTPLRIVDSQSGSVYVIVPEEVFARVQALVGDDLGETYPAQVESAMRAGWDDPVMDEYNDYDRHRTS